MLAAALIGMTALTADAAMREWTDQQGRKVTAEFVGTDGAGATAVVKLKLENGRIVPFKVADLSEADRVFVKSSLPSDVAALAAEIDKLVLNKMKESFYGLREEMQGLYTDEHMSVEDKKKRKAEIDQELLMCVPNKKSTDYHFMRRIYLDVAGRIPTYEEAERFLGDRSRDKRAALIDELLESEAYAMRMYNYFSDLFRVREGILMNGNGDLKADPYIEWIKANMRDDKPYDQMVREMLTATGKLWDDPATGYLVSDQGMRLCNLSNTFTIFMGTEITCAQCHDHPFEQVYQKDFYQLATFMGETETRGRGRGMMMMGEGAGNYREEASRMSKILFDAGKLRENETEDRQLRDIAGTHSTFVHDSGSNKVVLPHDYKYDNGLPERPVEPGAYFGDPINLEKHDSLRDAFATWVTSKGNPRFTTNIVNRLWKMAFGLGQIEPVDNIPGHLDGQAQNIELLTFLEQMMQDSGFSIKDFMRVVYNTETYQREAETLSPSLVQIDNGTYH
ncbi:MAG: DUF1549 domain-containing protein, partial [Verrucomicrobiota bacterium]